MAQVKHWIVEQEHVRPVGDVSERIHHLWKNGEFTYAVDQIVGLCGEAAVASGWWHKDGERRERNEGELIALMHSELSEALEGVRKNLDSDHLSDAKMVDEEMADVVIRVFDYCYAKQIDVTNVLLRKLAFNLTREDHKVENREKDGGKSF